MDGEDGLGEGVCCLSGCLALSLSVVTTLSHLQTSPSDLHQPGVPPVSPGSQPLDEGHASAQPQQDVHRLPASVPEGPVGHQGLRDVTGWDTGDQ